jgi:hypothetical protein
MSAEQPGDVSALSKIIMSMSWWKYIAEPNSVKRVKLTDTMNVTLKHGETDFSVIQELIPDIKTAASKLSYETYQREVGKPFDHLIIVSHIFQCSVLFSFNLSSDMIVWSSTRLTITFKANDRDSSAVLEGTKGEVSISDKGELIMQGTSTLLNPVGLGILYDSSGSEIVFGVGFNLTVSSKYIRL